MMEDHLEQVLRSKQETNDPSPMCMIESCP